MMRKFATLTVIESWMGNNDTRRTAHRATFAYTPRQGFLYVRSRAISSRTNDNFDHFPADEIKTAYRSFVGKPVFVNHHNSDHRRARGVIIDAALHEDRLGDGQDDTWVEVLMEIDAERYPKLARAILAGEIERTSMGCDVAYSICSVCNNRAATPLDYCKHIPAMKGQKIRRVTASGTQEDVLVFEKCYGLKFFENSVLVEDPADPTALVIGVDDRGLGGGYNGSLTALKDPDLTPGITQADTPDSGGRHAKAIGDLPQRELPATRASSGGRERQQVSLDDEYVRLGEPAGRVGRAAQAATATGHVGGVVGRGAEHPVPGVVADGVVARVANHHALRDGADELLEAPAMGAHRAAPGIIQRQAAVSAGEPSPGPRVAALRPGAGVDLGQVPLHGGLGAHEALGRGVGLHDREDTRSSRTAWKRDQPDDPHSLANLNPADYEWVQAFDYGFEDAILKSIGSIWQALAEAGQNPTAAMFASEYDEIDKWKAQLAQIESKCIPGRPFKENGRCDHCGTNARYFDVFRYKPTGEWLCVGHTCAENRLGLATREDLDKARRDWVLKGLETKRENAEKDRKFNADPRRVKVRDFLLNYRSLVEKGEYRQVGFYEDLLRSLKQYHDLTEGQLSAVERGMDKFTDEVEEFALRRRQELADESNAQPCPTGTETITGKVLSTKWQDSQYGSTLKMLVRDDRGFKVWGTVPSSINVERMDRVTFVATIEPSNDDPSFGFFRRPTKAEILPRTAKLVAAGGHQIRWFAFFGNERMPYKKGMVPTGWGAECSCGWQYNTAEIKARVTDAVLNHKFEVEHGTWDEHPEGMGRPPYRDAALTKKAAMTTYTLVQSSEAGAHTFELHIAGCGDLKQPKYSSATQMDIQADSLDEAIDLSVDFELGYTLDDLKVFSCARSGVAPAPRALDPDLCPGTGMPLDNPQRRLQVPCPVCGKSVKAADQRTGRTRKDIPRHKPATTAALRAPQGVRMTASKLAYGETVAPRQVSTLRDDSCPVCGEVTGFNGERCMTCGYFKPPDEFMDPDLTKAKEVDLRQNQEESDEIDAEGDSDDVFDLNDPTGTPADAADPNADGDPEVDGEVTSGPTTPAEEGAEKAADDQEAPLDLKGQESPAPDPAPGRQVADEDAPELKGTVFELAKPEEEVQEPAQPDPAPAPPEQDEGGDDSASEDDDDQEDDESSPPKKPKKQSTRRNRGESMRPTLKALAEQQIMLEANKKAISTIAALAGVDVSRIYAQAERRIASLQRRADAENPAQPLPEPSAEAPSESSDEALGNLNDADVTSVGTVTEDDGLSGTTVDVTAVGEVMADETAATADVTAPTSGAAMEDQDATLQGDVTARGLDAENAFPIEPAFAAAAQNRVFASLRLARLRLQAGIAQGDDLALSEQIAKSAMTDESIRHEIGTLSAVTRTASASPRQSVPMTREVRRAVPSLGATASSGTPAAIGGSNPAIEDSFLFD